MSANADTPIPSELVPGRPDAHEQHEAALKETHPQAQRVIPGPPEVVADEIERVSVEGRPADPKIGPVMLHWLLVGGGVVIVGAAAVLAWAVDMGAGVAALVIGCIAFVFSPGFLVAWARANEREDVANRMAVQNEDRPVITVPEPHDHGHAEPLNTWRSA